MSDFLGGCRGPFDFNELETRLSALHSKLNPESDCSDASNAASGTSSTPSASAPSAPSERLEVSSASAAGLHSITVGDHQVIGLLECVERRLDVYLIPYSVFFCVVFFRGWWEILCLLRGGRDFGHPRGRGTPNLTLANARDFATPRPPYPNSRPPFTGYPGHPSCSP